MDLNAYEDALVTKLQTDITGIEVRAFPDDFNNYISQLTHPGGAILISFSGASWDESEGNAQKVLTQNGKYVWEFIVIKKNYSRTKQHQGVTGTIEDIRQALSGFTPTGFDDSSVLEPVSSSFLQEIHGFYAYNIIMSHTIEESEA